MPDWTQDGAVAALEYLGYKVATPYMIRKYRLPRAEDGKVVLWLKVHGDIRVRVIDSDGNMYARQYSQLRRVK